MTDNNKWLQIVRTYEAEDYATGLRGVWDAIVAWWTGEDRRKYQNVYTFSVWAKDESATFFGAQVHTTQKETTDDKA